MGLVQTTCSTNDILYIRVFSVRLRLEGNTKPVSRTAFGLFEPFSCLTGGQLWEPHYSNDARAAVVRHSLLQTFAGGKPLSFRVDVVGVALTRLDIAISSKRVLLSSTTCVRFVGFSATPGPLRECILFVTKESPRHQTRYCVDCFPNDGPRIGSTGAG